MDTLMLAYEHAATMAEIATWANDLRGQEAPGVPGSRITRVVRFQVLDKGEGYTALILVEITDRISEGLVALKATDVVEIEQIASGIEDLPMSEEHSF